VPVWTRLPPAGARYGWRALERALRSANARGELVDALSSRLADRPVTLHRSGREALRVGFEALARRSGRREIAVSAYTCYSVPAAAIAAGLAVRLVDTNAAGQIDVGSLARTDLAGCAALVVSNLFGVAEPLAPIRAVVAGRNVALVDDAAQALGAVTGEGSVGARGDLGILSFGRAKPLSGLGGGAIVWPSREAGERAHGAPDRCAGGASGLGPVLDSEDEDGGEVVGEGHDDVGAGDGAEGHPGLAMLIRGEAWNLALSPAVFRLLAAVPGLGIGETHFDPEFRRGAMPRDAIALARAALLDFDRELQDRCQRARALARAVRARTRFTPLLAGPPEAGVHPRLGVVAPDSDARDEALRRLRPAGVTAMYPASLDRVPALRPRLIGSLEMPGARDFAARLLTLPTHAGVSAGWQERILSTLERCA